MEIRGHETDYLDLDRQPERFPMQFTERDGRILEHIQVHGGFLTDKQVMRLEFQGMRQTQDRLAKLFHNGFLNRTNQRGRGLYQAMVYWLAEPGAEHVAAVLGDDWLEFKQHDWVRKLPRPPLFHDLSLVDFMITVLEACDQTPWLAVHYWLNEGAFRADPDRVTYTSITGKQVSRNIIPDRFLVVVRTNEERPFYSRLIVEMDMATHRNKRFADQKVLAGLAYVKSKAYSRRFGSQSGRFLVITKSPKRLEFLKATTEQVAGRDAYMWNFADVASITEETVLTEPIWYQGGREEPLALFGPRD
jgi:hypothetical protein